MLKNNTLLRRIGKKILIYKAFKNDAYDFSRFFVEEANRRNDYRYSIMLLVHSLEKGMCMPNPRPFGFEKVHELISCLDKTNNHSSFEYRLAISILFSWIRFFDEHGWTYDDTYVFVKKYLIERNNSDLLSGYKEYKGSSIDKSEKYYDVISTRHSVRDFKSDTLKDDDVDFAVKCFIETPTACNRQMCGLIYVDNPEVKRLLDNRIIGLPGFNEANIHYFVITYDLAAFAYSGERQQGLFNAGLCTTNFINALHSKGIGSCCLQWSNKTSEDKEVRKALGLQSGERIGIIVGCGYYKENNLIPCSTRKSKEDIYRVI